jgi:hypothetical protein
LACASQARKFGNSTLARTDVSGPSVVHKEKGIRVVLRTEVMALIVRDAA